jgi:hypothetical protein
MPHPMTKLFTFGFKLFNPRHKFSKLVIVKSREFLLDKFYFFKTVVEPLPTLFPQLINELTQIIFFYLSNFMFFNTTIMSKFTFKKILEISSIGCR